MAFRPTLSERSFAKAIRIIGGQTATARKLDTAVSNVWQWLRVKRRAPAEYVLRLEALTKGQVTRHDLRRDLYPKPPKAQVRK